jgi:hypothetical protein
MSPYMVGMVSCNPFGVKFFAKLQPEVQTLCSKRKQNLEDQLGEIKQCASMV